MYLRQALGRVVLILRCICCLFEMPSFLVGQISLMMFWHQMAQPCIAFESCFFATLVGWEHLAQQAKVRQPTSLTVNACLCGSHAQNICMLELAVRKGHRKLQKIQWIRRTRTMQRWIIAGDPWNILKCIVTVDPLYLGSWVRWAGVGDGHGFGWCYQPLSCRGPLWKLVKKCFQVCPISVVLGLKLILYLHFGWIWVV